MFSDFYGQLDELTLIDSTKSGFLTELSVEHPDDYDEASFRIIKETINLQQSALIPVIQKDSSDYACILVDNTSTGIHKGLKQLKTFCHQKKLRTDNHLWQINSGDPIKENGSSAHLWLDFVITGISD